VRPIIVAFLFSALGAVAQRESPRIPLVSFAGTGQESIQAMVSDPQGNIYAAGKTTSPNFPVVAARQPQIAGSSAMRSSDSGATWARLTNPPAGLQLIQPDPVNPQVLFGASTAAIYKSANTGQSWSPVFSNGGSGLSGLIPVIRSVSRL
jgi:hypothetical protein